jgi:ABC-type antimicrobial peptide transport system permease subunit
MALGASARDVVGLVLRDGFFLTAAGVALGVPLAILVSFALAAVFVDVGGFDGLVVSVATIVLAVSATIASAVPARGASRIQPLRALQGD